MTSLILRPSNLPEKSGKPWSLQIRNNLGPETEYTDIACVSDDVAKMIIEAGAAYWLYGEPNWITRYKAVSIERARLLEEEAEAIRVYVKSLGD